MHGIRWTYGCALSLVMIAACGDDATSASGSESASTGEATTTSPPTTSTTDTPPSSSTTTATTEFDSSGSTESPGESSSGDSESGEPPAVDEFARGIRLDRLTINQATQVEVVVDGLKIAPEDYSTRLIPGRRTLVRGFWKLHADFEPRELIGRLTISYADGATSEQDFVQVVQGEASDGGGSSSFQWLLEPEDVRPGMQIRAKLLEPDPANAPGEVSNPPPVAPLSGQVALEIFDRPLELRVTLVPVLHQFEGCESMPEIRDEDVEAMRIELEQTNPVQTVIMTVREPMPYTETIGEGAAFSAILAVLAQTRAADKTGASEYYYGLLEPCDGYPPGLGGQAIAIAGPPTRNNGGERVSTGRWNGSGAAAASTFVHEIGHTQGRRHIVCSGGEAGPELDYPHANGRIGTWGFGIYDFELRTPTGGRDYMTYCSNEWVSDYGWEQTLDVIEVLTSFDYEDTDPPPASGIVLAGMLHEDGTAQWWTRSGRTPVHRYTARGMLTMELEGGLIEVEATISDVPHSKARYVEVDVPTGFGSVTAANLAADGAVQAIDLAAVNRLDSFAK